MRGIEVQVDEEGDFSVTLDKVDSLSGESVGEPVIVFFIGDEGVFKGGEVATAICFVTLGVSSCRISPPGAANVFVEPTTGGVVFLHLGAMVLG